MALFGNRSGGKGGAGGRALAARAEKLVERGKHAKALALAQEALEVARRELAPDDRELAARLELLGRTFFLLERPDEAAAPLAEAVEILDSGPGPDTELLQCLFLLAGSFQLAGQQESAWPVWARWVDLVRAWQLPHQAYPGLVSGLAEHHADHGRYAAAAEVLEENLAMSKATLGEETPAYCGLVGFLAGTLEAAGRYRDAESVGREFVALSDRVHGEESLELAVALFRLASIQRALSELDAAKELLERTLAILARHPEPSDLLAGCLWQLAEIDVQRGELSGAEASFRRAIELFRQLPETSADLPTALEGLGELQRRTGHTGKAERSLREAYELNVELYGDGSPQSAMTLTYLATLPGAHEPAEAAALMDGALATLRATLGERHPAYARSLHDAGVLASNAGQLERARELLGEALELKRASFGADHPVVANGATMLGALELEAGRAEEARTRLLEATEIYRRRLGRSSFDAITARALLARADEACGRFEEALASLQEALAGESERTGQLFSLSSEGQRTRFLGASTGLLDRLLTLVTRHLADDPAAVRAAFEQVLRRKGIGAEAVGRQRRAVLGGRYPQAAEKLEALAALESQIAEATLAGPGQRAIEDHARRLAEMTERRDELEIELARAVPEVDLAARLAGIGLDDVVRALPAGSGLIELIEFRPTSPAAGEERRYAAFVVRSDAPDRVALFDLGGSSPLARHLADLRSAVAGDEASRSFKPVRSGAGDAGREAGRLLRAGLVDPLLGALAGCGRWFVSPDGDLNRLPFEILTTEDGRHLIDEVAISYLSAGRDLLRLGAGGTGQAGAPVVLADPDFDLAATVGTRVTGPATGGQSRDLERGATSFVRLPGTREEGERIAELLQAVPLLGAEAVEGRLKAFRSPRILHLATHGFFLPDEPRGDADEPPAWLPGDEARRQRLAGGLENPMLRSGLALAGANTWLRGEALPELAEDALLNGVDVSGLDLLDTELVVLSACETGLGDIQAGEGVFGLRRAFVLAGARTLVMSLWKVPDEQTQRLMTDFYRRVLEGASRADALRQAQLALKREYPDPGYWGAFICQGEPGPLA